VQPQAIGGRADIRRELARMGRMQIANRSRQHDDITRTLKRTQHHLRMADAPERNFPIASVILYLFGGKRDKWISENGMRPVSIVRETTVASAGTRWRPVPETVGWPGLFAGP
jgi:hypothetical protein